MQLISVCNGKMNYLILREIYVTALLLASVDPWVIP